MPRRKKKILDAPGRKGQTQFRHSRPDGVDMTQYNVMLPTITKQLIRYLCTLQGVTQGDVITWCVIHTMESFGITPTREQVETALAEYAKLAGKAKTDPANEELAEEITATARRTQEALVNAS